jgi:signal transduction histidine kinase
LIQTEKMSSLGQLVAGVAHEINNPVNFIYGNLSHASEYAKDLLRLIGLYQEHYPDPAADIQAQTDAIDLEFVTEDLPKIMASMQVGTDRIRQIVQSLRNFSHLDQAEMKRVNIHDGIESTLLILHHRLREQVDALSIEVIKEYGDLPRVECYAGQLNQVFMNVLSNAVDALEERRQATPREDDQPTIWIQTAVTRNNSVSIQIRDNGPGIPEAVVKRIFDPFFSTKPIGKGTGLGLSISYQIVVDKHGGVLQCYSQAGQGTAFSIEIPISQSDD